jgi:hypothetical protein
MKLKIFTLILVAITFFTSCEKEIQIDLPAYEPKLVVEGYIEQGGYPFVMLSKSIPYFEPVDTNTVNNIMVSGNEATVIVSDGTQSDTLQFISYGNFKAFVGTKFTGEVGKTYHLTILYNGKTYNASTTITTPVPIDSIKFYPDPESGTDTLGFLWIYAKDPDTLGNYYRVFTKTLGKDMVFVHPRMSVDEDKYFNGVNLEFSVYHGLNMMKENEYDDEGKDSLGIKWYYFVMGETVVVKLCTMDRAHFLFWRTAEQQQSSDGNPFASPVTPYTNIEGGALGVWGGYGVYLDTVTITPDIIKR